MKSKAPFMSINPSGSIARTLVASHIRGKNYVSFTHKPGGKPSSAQVNRRSQFLIARDGWLSLTLDQKAEYNLRARLMPLTGYNLFIKEFKLEDMLSITKKITSAQLLDLVANPVEIIPAPGTGKYIFPLVFQCFSPLSANAYFTDLSDMTFAQSSSFGDTYIQDSPLGVLSDPANKYSSFDIYMRNIQMFENNALMLVNNALDLTLGDKDLYVVVSYLILDFPF